VASGGCPATTSAKEQNLMADISLAREFIHNYARLLGRRRPDLGTPA